MIIFEGRYSWDGKKLDGREPIAWFAGAYDLKIVRLDDESKKIMYLKPVLCLFTNTGQGHSVSANPEKFAKHICEDFSLDLEKVLWVEQLKTGTREYEVLLFSRRGRLGEHVFYSVARRPPVAGELQLIEENR